MKRLSKYWLKFLASLGVGWYSDQMYRLAISEDGHPYWQPTDSRKFAIVVIGRQHYSEKQQLMPIEDRKELSKVLLLQQQSAQHSGCFIIHSPQDAGRTAVNIWHWEDSVPFAPLRIPETLLLTDKLKQLQAMSYETPSGKAFVVNTASGIVSARANAMIKDMQTFALASGIPLSASADAKAVSIEQHASHCVNALPHILQRHIQRLYQRQHQQKNNLLPAGILLGAISAGVVYLAVSSAYLVGQDYLLEHSLESKRDDVTKALNIQKQYQSLVDVQQQQIAFAQQQSLSTPIWEIVEPLMQQAHIQRISYRDNQILVNGETDKAVDLLQQLLADKRVANAQFERPVMKQRNSEAFSIRFQLKEAANGDA